MIAFSIGHNRESFAAADPGSSAGCLTGSRLARFDQAEHVALQVRYALEAGAEHLTEHGDCRQSEIPLQCPTDVRSEIQA
jgi:hypothetical protein